MPDENGQSIIVSEHFWFTAMTVGFNAFVFEKIQSPGHYVLTATIVINLYAIFLILHRAAAHAGKLTYPKWISEIDEPKKKFYHKGVETLCHFRAAAKMVPTVIFEFSGAFFYILLILFSFLAILID